MPPGSVPEIAPVGTDPSVVVPDGTVLTSAEVARAARDRVPVALAEPGLRRMADSPRAARNIVRWQPVYGGNTGQLSTSRLGSLLEPTVTGQRPFLADLAV